MTVKNRIISASSGALAFATATLLVPWIPDVLVWLFGTGGVVVFLAALTVPTQLRQPPIFSMTILDKGYATPEDIHNMLGIWLPTGNSALDARDAQWTVARHTARWRANRVIEVLGSRGVIAECRMELLSAVQWVGVHLLPAFLGLLFMLPILAISGFNRIGNNFLQTLLLFVIWGAVALIVRGILEKHVIHRFVWEPELTSDGLRFLER